MKASSGQVCYSRVHAVLGQVAAALAGTLSAALGVGASGGDGARSWQQLPQFICVCGLAKLATLIAVLPLLAWVVRSESLVVGSGRASTHTSRTAAMRISAGQIRRRWQVWLAQNRQRASIAFSVTAAVAAALVCVALFASAPRTNPAPTPTQARPPPWGGWWGEMFFTIVCKDTQFAKLL